jgi:hypothetical protein
MFLEGRAVAQAVSRWLPTTASRFRVRAEHVGFVVDKAALGEVFFEYFGFPANHSTNFSIIIITRGWHNRPIGGRSAEWTGVDPTFHYTNLKKICFLKIGRRTKFETQQILTVTLDCQNPSEFTSNGSV